jgi:hypothetical protein
LLLPLCSAGGESGSSGSGGGAGGFVSGAQLRTPFALAVLTEASSAISFTQRAGKQRDVLADTSAE